MVLSGYRMAQINPLLLPQAIAIGDGIYELILTNWGNRGQAQESNNGSVLYPPMASVSNNIALTGKYLAPPLTGMFALAIAPRSDVDRCIINYQNQPQAMSAVTDPIGPDASFLTRGGILETEQILSIHSPLIGQQPGPLLIRAHPETWFTDTYHTTTGGTGSFGTAAGAYQGGELYPPAAKTVFVNPQLRLLMYTTSKSTLPPTRRAPGFWAFQQDCSGNNSEKLVRIIPVGGRTSVTVSVYPFSGTTFTVRVTGVFYYQNAIPSGNMEVELFPSTAISTPTDLTMCGSDIPSNLAFILIYMEPDPPGAGALGNFSVAAYDR